MEQQPAQHAAEDAAAKAGEEAPAVAKILRRGACRNAWETGPGLGVMVRLTGATTLGATRVIGADWKVRMPRLPKLPPIRASAGTTASIEATMSKAANTPPSLRNLRLVIGLTP